MECNRCGKEYEAKRSTSRYCSVKCRKLAFLQGGVSVPENGKVSVPGVSVPRAKDAKLLQALGTGQGIPNYGLPDCQCKHCQSNRANNGKLIINHGPYKPANQLEDHEVNRVCLPGDPDYKGYAVC